MLQFAGLLLRPGLAIVSLLPAVWASVLIVQRYGFGVAFALTPLLLFGSSLLAIGYLVLVNETAGEDWLHPDWFRFGASTLLNDLLLQRQRMATGAYSGPDYVTLD